MTAISSANRHGVLVSEPRPQEAPFRGATAWLPLARPARSTEAIGTSEEEDPAWPGHSLQQNADRQMRTFGQHADPCRDASSEADMSACSRVIVFKKWNSEAELIVGKDSVGDKAPNPLRVRSWFFSIGEFLGKVDTVLQETESIRCAGKERIDEILVIFRRHGIFAWIARAIEAEQSCGAEQAKARAEKLVRYAFANTI